MTDAKTDCDTQDFAKQTAEDLIAYELKVLNETTGGAERHLANFRTLSIRALSRIMKTLGIPWSMMSQLADQYVPVHPDVSKYLKKLCQEDDDVEDLLSQDFVKIDKLKKLNSLKSRGKFMEWLCGVDGIGVRHGGPILDWKRYIDNLRYSLHGDTGNYDDEQINELKRIHVQTIRKIHIKVANKDTDNIDSTKVYRVMKSLVRDECGFELSDASNMSEMDASMVQELKEFYLSSVGKDNFQKITKLFKLENERKKIDIEKRKSDGEVKSNKRKKVEDTENEPRVVTTVTDSDIEEETNNKSDDKMSITTTDRD